MPALTILLIDISGGNTVLGGSSQVGEPREAITAFTDLLGRHQGKVLKTIGGKMLCSLPTPVAAATGAFAILDSLEGNLIIPPGTRVRFSLQAVPESADQKTQVSGAIDACVKMLARAQSGEVVTNRATAQQLQNPFRSQPAQGGTPQDGIFLISKGFMQAMASAPAPAASSAPEFVPDVPPEASTAATQLVRRSAPKESSTRALKLKMGSVQIAVDDNKPTVTIGRDVSNDLVVTDSMASRMHARIELRAGKFYLVDSSSNGTFVSPEYSQKFKVSQGERQLSGAGFIGLGHEVYKEDPQAIKFILQLER
jgi:hypothetical protein